MTGASHPGWTPMPTTETKPRIALLGGTFDPVHLGHVHLFHEAYAVAGISRLIVIPVFISNFKRGTHPASFAERAEMLRLAICDYRDIYPEDRMEVEISLYEGEKGGVSYTSETIRAFYDEAADCGKVNFIIGDDLIASLGSWHDIAYLRSHVRFICFTRLGNAVENTSGAEVVFIRSDVFHASSSEVRAGERGMLSPRVRKFVDENKLYGA